MGKLLDRLITLWDREVGPADWRVDGCSQLTVFEGHYLIFDRQGHIKQYVRGRIVQHSDHQVDVYVYDPPPFVKDHPHGQCMQLLSPNDKWFKLHFERPAADFSGAYTYVEHLLTEAYQLTH